MPAHPTRATAQGQQEAARNAAVNICAPLLSSVCADPVTASFRVVSSTTATPPKVPVTNPRTAAHPVRHILKMTGNSIFCLPMAQSLSAAHEHDFPEHLKLSGATFEVQREVFAVLALALDGEFEDDSEREVVEEAVVTTWSDGEKNSVSEKFRTICCSDGQLKADLYEEIKDISPEKKTEVVLKKLGYRDVSEFIARHESKIRQHITDIVKKRLAVVTDIHTQIKKVV